MRHPCAAVAICAAAFLGACLAQDIPTDASKALAQEWKNPASTPFCLTALGAYITYTPPGSSLPLPPTAGATAALDVLLAGLVPAGLTSAGDLYRVAQKRADFLESLAKANTLSAAM